jgi:hypothetical protein
MKITVQGGVGTPKNMIFFENLEVDSVGDRRFFWFLKQLQWIQKPGIIAKSKEDDFYLSHLSPLGVPFNTVRGSSNEIFRRNKESKKMEVLVRKNCWH